MRRRRKNNGISENEVEVGGVIEVDLRQLTAQDEN